MTLHAQLENMEEFTNIGFAKAISEVPQLGVADLEEIAEHLLLVAKYRRMCAKMAAAKRMGVGE
jgi:hypothetical protein